MEKHFIAGFVAEFTKLAHDEHNPGFWGTERSRKLYQQAIEAEDVPVAKRVEIYKQHLEQRAKERPISRGKALAVSGVAAAVGAGLGAIKPALAGKEELHDFHWKKLIREARTAGRSVQLGKPPLGLGQIRGRWLASRGAKGAIIGGVTGLGLMGLLRSAQKQDIQESKRMLKPKTVEESFIEELKEYHS